LGTLMVSFTVPVSMLGVWTVSVVVPTVGFWTSYSPSPVFLQAEVTTSAAIPAASAIFFTSGLPVSEFNDLACLANLGDWEGGACKLGHLDRKSAFAFSSSNVETVDN
jgi:hypothetical protein